MGRQKKNEETRDRLLEQGIELLSGNGYHGTGLKKILDTVNVPKGSFYNYFESKEKYVSEIIETYSRQSLSLLDEYLAITDDDPITQIRTVYRAVLDELQKKGMQGCLVGNLAAEIGNTSTICQTAMQDAFRAWRSRFVPLFKQAQSGNMIRSDISAEVLTDIFWSAWEGGLLKMKIDGDTQRFVNMLDTIVDQLFSAV